MVDKKIEETSDSLDSAQTGGIAQKRTPEDTRHTLANTFVWGFLGIVVLVLVLSYLKGFNTNSVKDLLLTTSGILSGPLGFIIGYYFKSKED